MTFSLGIVGAGQFAGAFAKLFDAHPAISEVHVTDVLPERAEALRERLGLAGTYPSFEAMLDGGLDAVAIFTQRWTHGPLVLQATTTVRLTSLRQGYGGPPALSVGSSFADVSCLER